MVEVKWTDFAIDNLNDIGDYIEKDSFQYAQIVVNILFDSTDILIQHPYAGRIVVEFNDENIRELIRGSYRIIYKVLNDERIDILTVHHSARLLTELPKI